MAAPAPGPAQAPAVSLPASLPVTIDGKPAFLSFDDEHFFLHRVGPNKPYTSLSAPGPYDPEKASLLIPLALVLHAAFVADIDGGSLLVNTLSPPLTSRKSLGEAIGIAKKGTKAQSILSTPSSASSSQPADGSNDEDVRKADRLRDLLDGPCANLRLVKIEARIDAQHITGSSSSSASASQDPASYASNWCAALLARAYPSTKGITPHRRLFILVNPAGGPGKARMLFETRVRPIFEAAGCTLTVHYTTHHLHGFALVRDPSIFKLDAFDAIVTVSGDGMVHEVINALAARRDARTAIRIPIAPIPAGSGNASSVNLLGPKNGFSLALAGLNVIKGRPVAMDLCAVTQPYSGPDSDPYSAASLEPPARPKRGARKPPAPAAAANGSADAAPLASGTIRSQLNGGGAASAHSAAPSSALTEADAADLSTNSATLSSANASRLLPHHASSASGVDADPTPLTSAPTRPYVQYYAFLSAAIGLMADIDLGTEHMRALGDARFVIGYLQGVITNKECPVEIDLKLGQVGTVDRAEMRRRLVQARSVGAWNRALHELEEEAEAAEGSARQEGDGSLDAVLRHGSVLDPLVGAGESVPPPFNLFDPSWPIPALQSSTSSATSNGDSTSSSTAAWQRLTQPVSALYAGKMPYVARDLMQFPFSYPGDGTIDLALLLQSSGRIGKLRSISSAENGEVVYDRDVGYAKVEALRVTPKLPKGDRRLKGGGMISIDGEGVEYAPFQIEVAKGVHWYALSLYGNFASPIVFPPGTSSEAEAEAELQKRNEAAAAGR
ncbi:sphinganine kinase lcb4 [Tilletia horrida]|nr:sphinganine kinase lcb4 [Tilletia horrida]